MTIEGTLATLRRGAVRRAALVSLATSLPWLAVAIAATWRLRGVAAWGAATLAAAAVLATLAGWHAWHVTRRFDRRWLARALDAARPDMEDSAALLFADAPGTVLQVLQRARLEQRLLAKATPELRPAWHARRRLAGALAAGAIAVAVVAWPLPGDVAEQARPGASPPATAALPPRLRQARIDVEPPAYTGQAPRGVDALSARVPEQAVLRWTVRYAPVPPAVELVFHDGQRLALSRKGDTWQGSRRMLRPSLYRVVARHAPAAQQARLHRIDVVADRAPTLRVLEPARSPAAVVPGQRHWSLLFEASDDHGLAPTAQLRITRTEGSGENISAREQTIALRGQGSPTRRRYAHRIDLAALGLAPGDDLIVQLRTSDRRAPMPQEVRSPSQILRWPAPKADEAGGLDGLVKQALPAYFRSQRQVILDAEALLARRRSLDADTYVARSDSIGVDQRLLRLRYGQFLGEESEGAPILPTNDADEAAPPAPGVEPHDIEATDAHAGAQPAAHDAAPAQPAGTAAAAGATNATLPPASGDDDHGHVPATRQAGFGEQAAVLERFGHTHDHAGAATLLDPETRRLLKAALDAMWQSEGELRQGEPGRALPHANRALGFIKQVQQASRIYLPRVGPDLPPIDATRRLGGDRAGIAPRADPLRPATPPDPLLAEAWQALGPASSAGPDLDALARRVAGLDPGAGDPLALAAAMEALRRDGACQACRERLRALLWPLLAPPPAAPGPRQGDGPGGDAYLDALRREAPP